MGLFNKKQQEEIVRLTEKLKTKEEYALQCAKKDVQDFSEISNIYKETIQNEQMMNSFLENIIGKNQEQEAQLEGVLKVLKVLKEINCGTIDSTKLLDEMIEGNKGNSVFIGEDNRKFSRENNKFIGEY